MPLAIAVVLVALSVTSAAAGFLREHQVDRPDSVASAQAADQFRAETGYTVERDIARPYPFLGIFLAPGSWKSVHVDVTTPRGQTVQLVFDPSQYQDQCNWADECFGGLIVEDPSAGRYKLRLSGVADDRTPNEDGWETPPTVYWDHFRSFTFSESLSGGEELWLSPSGEVKRSPEQPTAPKFNPWLTWGGAGVLMGVAALLATKAWKRTPASL